MSKGSQSALCVQLDETSSSQRPGCLFIPLLLFDIQTYSRTNVT